MYTEKKGINVGSELKMIRFENRDEYSKRTDMPDNQKRNRTKTKQKRWQIKFEPKTQIHTREKKKQ